MNIDLNIVSLVLGTLLILIGGFFLFWKNVPPLWRHREARFNEHVMAKINRKPSRPQDILSREQVMRHTYRIVLDIIMISCGILIVYQSLGL